MTPKANAVPPRKNPDKEDLSDRGEAWVLQIAGTDWGSGSGGLRVSRYKDAALIGRLAARLRNLAAREPAHSPSDPRPSMFDLRC